MANRTFNDVKLFVAFQMASQREQLPNNANISQLMGILARYVNDFHSCAFNGDASTVNGHSVATDVPSNAKFTDTITPVMDNLSKILQSAASGNAAGSLAVKELYNEMQDLDGGDEG